MQSGAGLDSNNLRANLLFPIAYLVNRPRGMLGDEWLRVAGRTFEGWKVGWITYIAEGDAHIA